MLGRINKISLIKLRNFAYLADMRFSSVTQMPSALRISDMPSSEIVDFGFYNRTKIRVIKVYMDLIPTKRNLW